MKQLRNKTCWWLLGIAAFIFVFAGWIGLLFNLLCVLI